MAEPWFDPIRWGWLPGTALGVLGGVWGTVAGLVGRKYPGLLAASLWAWLGGSSVLLLAGLVALFQGQPYGIWYGLLLPGVLGSAMGVMFLLMVLPSIREAHRREEEQKMQAHDLG
jgi:zinc transporter ZupT